MPTSPRRRLRPVDARHVAVVWLLSVALTLTPGGSAPAARSEPPTGARASQGWQDVPVRNASFSNAGRGWRAQGRGARLSIVTPGHRDRRAGVLVGPPRRSVLLQPRTSLVSSTAAGATYRVSMWVRGLSSGASVSLTLTEIGPGGRVGEAHASARVGASWRRLRLTHRATTSGADLDLRIRRTGRRAAHAIAVDDVALLVRRSASTSSKPPRPTSSASSASAAWWSGASGAGVGDGSFAAWRGRPLDIAGTWNDNIESQEHQWSLREGFEYGDWSAHIDDAVGAIYRDRGETWAAAGRGAYDARWRAMLDNLADAWAGRPGTFYLRFAHEFNGEWYPWSVRAGEVADFKRAWIRFRSLQREIFPAAKLVFCPNAESSASLGLDWRDAFPGRDHVDVMGVDLYNQYPFAASAEQFGSALRLEDDHGAPRGLEQHRRFAQSVGLPFAVPEWSSNAGMGDSAAFVAGLHDWLGDHAGTGPGQLLYEIEFNVPGYGDSFQLFPTTLQPRAAASYRKLW